MARKHAFVIAIFLGLAAAVGAVAAINTARLGGPQAKAVSTQSQTAQLQRRSRLLNTQAAALRRALAKRPPKLPEGPGVRSGRHARDGTGLGGRADPGARAACAVRPPRSGDRHQAPLARTRS